MLKSGDEKIKTGSLPIIVYIKNCIQKLEREINNAGVSNMVIYASRGFCKNDKENKAKKYWCF